MLKKISLLLVLSLLVLMSVACATPVTEPQASEAPVVIEAPVDAKDSSTEGPAAEVSTTTAAVVVAGSYPIVDTNQGLCYDDSGVNHTDWVHEKALAYLDELIKQRKPKTGSYLDMLNKLGIQGFSSLDQKEYITTLKNIKADLLGEYE